MAVTKLNTVVALERFWQTLMCIWVIVASGLALNGVNLYKHILPKEGFEFLVNDDVYHSVIATSVAIILLNGYLVWALKKATDADDARKQMEWVCMEWVFLYLMAASLVIFMIFSPIKLWMYSGKVLFFLYKFWSIKTVENHSRTAANKQQ